MSQPADPRPPQILQGPVAEEIDIMAVLRLLYAKRLSLFLGGVSGAVLGLLLSFAVPDLYTSTVKVSPVSGGGMSSMLQQYGGLASLAGLALPQTGDEDKTALALATLDSDAFLTKFITTHGFQKEILAATAWDSQTGQLQYESEYIDANGNFIEMTGLQGALIQEQLVDRFKEALLVSEDKVSGFITLRFTHVSPGFASELLALLVGAVNSALRDADVREAEAAIVYLEEYSERVQYAEVKEAVYGLVQSQIETIMLANVRPEYVFRIIDGPSVPVNRASPIRPLYALLGAISSITLSLAGWGLIRLHRTLNEA